MDLKDRLALELDLQNIDFVKGIYKDTAQNRKLGKVGQKYGGKKEEDSELTVEKIRNTVENWRREKGVDYVIKVDDVSFRGSKKKEFIIEPSTSKHKEFAGMVINYTDDRYEVAEMQAGKNQTDIKVFLETKSLRSALNSMHRGNKQKPKHVIDMS